MGDILLAIWAFLLYAAVINKLNKIEKGLGIVEEEEVDESWEPEEF